MINQCNAKIILNKVTDFRSFSQSLSKIRKTLVEMIV